MINHKFDFNTENERNPFVTPPDYFDSLTERVMQRVDAESAKTERRAGGRIVVMRRISIAVAAASVAALVFLHWPDSSRPVGQATSPTTITSASSLYETNDVNEEALNYAMVDESDIYNYLAGTYE